MHPEDKERVERAWRRAVEEKTLYEAEYRLRRKEGDCCPMVARAAPVFGKGGSVREWLGAHTDVSERDRLLAALERSNRALDVSHDLRSPLNTILMSAALLGRSSSVAEKDRANLQRIERAARQMDALISDLLDVSRMDAGSFALEPSRCSPAELVEEAIESELEKGSTFFFTVPEHAA